MNFTRILLLLTVFFASPLFAMGQVTYQQNKTVHGYWEETYKVTLDGAGFAYSCLRECHDQSYYGSMTGDLRMIKAYMIWLSNQKYCVLASMRDSKTVFYVLKKEYERQQALSREFKKLYDKMSI